MYTKIAIAILVCFGVATFAASLNKIQESRASRSASQQQEEPPNTLKARVKKVRAKGANKVTFDSPLPIYAETSSLDEASSAYVVVVARPVWAKTLMLSPDKLTTFQKFEIIDRLNSPPNVGCCGPQTSDFPSELPPPGPNAIYVRMNGGKMLIDGVEVTQKTEFQLRGPEQYLLFLLPDATGVISTIPLGPYGIFTVKEGSIESILNYPHTLDSEIRTKHGKSLNRLKTELKRSRGND
jgi:hypothetical protein